MPLTHIGRYEIIETLGLGEMGIVYKGYDPLIERAVAIKTVGWSGLTRAESDEFEQRFFREARSAGRLNHPNIVTIHDIGRCNDLAFITMEFLGGRSLRDMLDAGVALPPWRTAEIVAAIADGLAFAHAHDVVHRDINPANIFVLDNGTVKIAGFAVALLPGASARYTAPERMAGKGADARSDIFSLGVVLYELLTGQPPFAGDSAPATPPAQTPANPALLPPSVRIPDLPVIFDRIVASALAIDPEQRYQNAAEMAAELRIYQNIPGKMHPEAAADAVVAEDTTPLPITPAADAPPPAGRAMQFQAQPLARGFATALLALAPLAGLLLLYPAPPPAAPGPLAAAPAPVIVGASPAHVAAMPVPALTPAATVDHAEPAAPAVAQGGIEYAQISPPPTPAKRPATPAGRQKAVATQSTQSAQTAMRADIAACDRQPFFQRVYCVEKARWKYCADRWGSTEECSYGNKERG